MRAVGGDLLCDLVDHEEAGVVDGDDPHAIHLPLLAVAHLCRLLRF